MAQKAVAISILGIAKTGSDYTVTAFAQPEAAYIPEGGTGKSITVDVPPAGSGTSDPVTQKIACKVFITHDQVKTTDGQRYKLGLMISAANGTVNIGPFFGNLDFNSGQKTLAVKITTPLLNGSVTITLKGPSGNQFNIKAGFTGLLSGTTSVDRDI